MCSRNWRAAQTWTTKVRVALQKHISCCFLVLSFLKSIPGFAWQRGQTHPLNKYLLHVQDWSAPSCHFHEWQKCPQGTPRTQKDSKPASFFWLQCWTTQVFQQTQETYRVKKLLIHQHPDVRHVFGVLLSLGLESCALNIIWGCSLSVTQKSRRRILWLSREHN